MGWIKGLYVVLLATSLVLRIATVVENYRQQRKFRKQLGYDKPEEDTEENSRA